MKSNNLCQKTTINTHKNKTIKLLQVIHGYPPYYIAGSEIYTANLCNELSKNIDVTVFTRIEDEYKKPYDINESFENGIKIIRVNKPGRDNTFRNKYIDKEMGNIFEKPLLKLKPNIVHIGHLSHLTIIFVKIIKKYNIPILFTLHDFWMICIRGQLISVLVCKKHVHLLL